MPVHAARTALASDPAIVWLNGTHGAGKTTTSALVQRLIPDSPAVAAPRRRDRPPRPRLHRRHPGDPHDRPGRAVLARDQHGHFVLHADQDTLRRRIEGEHPVPSPFRLKYLEPYAEAARTWLHGEAEVIDTTHLTPAQAAQQIAEALKS